MLFFLLITGFLMVLLLSLLGWVMGNKQKQLKEKLSPFECGFDNFPNYRFPLSLRFFMMTMLFLLFDMEIVLLLPLPICMAIISNSFMMILLVLFVILLVMGLFYEWQQGTIDWN